VPYAIISPSRTILPLDATFLFPFDSTSSRLIVPWSSGHARFVRAQENASLISLCLLMRLIFRYARINIFIYIYCMLKIIKCI